MELYFNKFPTTYYNNTACVDISRRVRFDQTNKRGPTAFYNYEVKAGSRPDMIADAYYEDSFSDWMIYLTNNNADPLYDWYLNEEDFNGLLIKKYGSVEESEERIKYWQTNWASDDEQLSPNYFDNSSTEGLKKYYEPIFGQGTRIVAYKRKPEDIFSNTNKIYSFNITSASNTFVSGERVTIKQTGLPVGSLEVISANSTVVIGQHIIGNTSPTNTFTGITSGATATISLTVPLTVNIPDSEIALWEPIYYYDWERQRNEERKIISVLDANYAPEVARELKIKLNE